MDHRIDPHQELVQGVRLLQASFDPVHLRKDRQIPMSSVQGTHGNPAVGESFEQAAFALRKPGDLSEVVKTRFGFHVLQLSDRPETQLRPFDQVKLSIRPKLQREAVDALRERLRAAAEVIKTAQTL